MSRVIKMVILCQSNVSNVDALHDIYVDSAWMAGKCNAMNLLAHQNKVVLQRPCSHLAQSRCPGAIHAEH